MSKAKSDRDPHDGVYLREFTFFENDKPIKIQR